MPGCEESARKACAQPEAAARRDLRSPHRAIVTPNSVVHRCTYNIQNLVTISEGLLYHFAISIVCVLKSADFLVPYKLTLEIVMVEGLELLIYQQNLSLPNSLTSQITVICVMESRRSVYRWKGSLSKGLLHRPIAVIAIDGGDGGCRTAGWRACLIHSLRSTVDTWLIWRQRRAKISFLVVVSVFLVGRSPVRGPLTK